MMYVYSKIKKPKCDCKRHEWENMKMILNILEGYKLSEDVFSTICCEDDEPIDQNFKKCQQTVKVLRDLCTRSFPNCTHNSLSYIYLYILAS